MNTQAQNHARKLRTKPSDGIWRVLRVLAAQTLKIASINGIGNLDKLETDLEDEISYDNRSPSKTAFGRIRREGHNQLHSKAVLFVVVLLNIIDTVFVMVGLILDFHHVSQLLEAKLYMLDSFADNLSRKYSIEKKDQDVLQTLLNAHIIFNTSSISSNVTELASECVHFLNNTAAGHNKSMDTYIDSLPIEETDFTQPNICFRSYVSQNDSYSLDSNGEIDSTLSTVAHKLHYCSLSILTILVIILMLKMVCSGMRFLKDHMQVFDGLITIISFVLDIVFINGVTFFNQEQFVVILTLLFPWRVIRILNSLIAAVLDKHKLNLKILYTQKKKITRTLSETNTKLEVLQKHVEILQNLCTSRGIGEYEISRALGADYMGGSHKNGGGGGLSSMMALGKLAFQAADAFAPITNGNKKQKSDESSPALSTKVNSVSSSPNRSDVTEITLASDNNNAVSKNQNDRISAVKRVSLTHSDSSPETLTPPSVDETVTVHINGSGPPRGYANQKRRKENKVSVSLPDLTEDDRSTDSDFVSRL